ncbi:hypothetical protein GCM10022382_22070 [Microbacterium invictum]
MRPCHTAHQTLAQSPASRMVRDQHSAHACNSKLATADTYSASRPADMADNLVLLPSDDMEVMRSIAIWQVRVPLPETLMVLGVEQSAKPCDVACCQIRVCGTCAGGPIR